MLESCGKESLLISFQIIVQFPQHNTSFPFIIRGLATQYLGIVISHRILAKASSTVSGFYLRQQVSHFLREQSCCSHVSLCCFILTMLLFPHRMYELPLNGGTPYERGVEVDPSISRRGLFFPKHCINKMMRVIPNSQNAELRQGSYQHAVSTAWRCLVLLICMRES